MAYRFLQAAHYTPVGGRVVDVVVIHTMEAPEKGSTAESVAAYFRTTDRKVSAHYCIDSDSVVQCVREGDVAWCAPGANHNGIHLEHAGYARQTAAEWRDGYTLAMLARSARLAAHVCGRHRLPITWLHPADLLAGRRGITSHNNVSEAFRRSTHWDPGPAFPIDAYLVQVQRFATGTVEPEPLVKQPPTVRRGARGWQVKRLQRLLQDRACWPEGAAIDGVFGPVTERAVRRFQRLAGLEPDGIVGPLTWHALLAATVEATRDASAAPVVSV